MRLLLLVEQGATGSGDTGAFAAFKENPWFLLLNLVCCAEWPLSLTLSPDTIFAADLLSTRGEGKCGLFERCEQ